MTKVMTIVGTRPEIIRLSEVIKRLDTVVDHVLVHTGQIYDYELNEVFFVDLGLRKPDHFLEVDTSSLGTVLGGVLEGAERVIRDERPDALLVLGDTNSAISALMAKRMKVPVYHMEAGNRCFDENVPEETNRRLLDHVCDFNLVYTEHARRNLLREGIHPRRILLTGSPMNEVLQTQADAIERSKILDELSIGAGDYFLVSAHREENVDDPDRLGALLDCLQTVVDETELPVLVSTHPRTRKRLDSLDRRTHGIMFHKPLGFHDYIKLQVNARCVLSDSGTISEEAAILGFSALTLRDSMERPEALDAGTVMMTGLDPANVMEGIRFLSTKRKDAEMVPDEYLVSDCADRTVAFILSTHRRHEVWTGVRAQRGAGS